MSIFKEESILAAKKKKILWKRKAMEKDGDIWKDRQVIK